MRSTNMIGMQMENESNIKHKKINPPVLYVGTPVALITTCNEDGTSNISPISSVWSLGDRFVLGMSSSSKCRENILREKECAINFPSAQLWGAVENIARSTGCNPVPKHKIKAGYEYVKDKFTKSGLTAFPSETIRPVRINECPIQVETKVMDIHSPGGEWPEERPESFSIVEVLVTAFHAHENIIIPNSNHINTNAWKPLFYVFRDYFGGGENLGRTFKTGNYETQ